MTIDGCEREPSVIAALRATAATPELENHLVACSACAETAHLAGSLLQHASVISAQTPPPAPWRIWRKMRDRRHQFDRRRATRGLFVMWLFSAVSLVALSVRYVPALWQTHFADMQLSLSFPEREMVLGSFALTVVLAAFGSCYLLVSSRRIDSRLL